MERLLNMINLYFWLNLNSTNKKTMKKLSDSLENVKDKAFEVLKIKEFTFVNDCFQNESNTVFGVF